MLMALGDPVFEVRVQVALGLTQMQDDTPTALDRDEVFEIARSELTTGRGSWHATAPSEGAEERASDAPDPTPTSDDLHRGLAHTFTVLGLVLEREPLSIAYRAMRADDPALRGTAYEYLEVVLPPPLRDLVIPLLGDVKPAAKSRERGKQELAAELLRSSASLARE